MLYYKLYFKIQVQPLKKFKDTITFSLPPPTTHSVRSLLQATDPTQNQQDILATHTITLGSGSGTNSNTPTNTSASSSIIHSSSKTILIFVIAYTALTI